MNECHDWVEERMLNIIEHVQILFLYREVPFTIVWLWCILSCEVFPVIPYGSMCDILCSYDCYKWDRDCELWSDVLRRHGCYGRKTGCLFLLLFSMNDRLSHFYHINIFIYLFKHFVINKCNNLAFRNTHCQICYLNDS